MKKLVFLVLIFCMFSGDSYANTAILNEYIQEAKEQVKKFMKMNNDLLKAGKKDQLNYTYVYRPGEKFEFRRPLPKSFTSSSVKLIENEWFYDPSGLVPSIDLFNETLVHYNTTKYNAAYRQQFIIVLDILQIPLFSKSLIETNPGTSHGIVADFVSIIPTTGVKYNQKIDAFYTKFINGLNDEFKIEYPQGDWGDDAWTILIFAFATIEKTNIARKTVNPNLTPELSINLKISQMWNNVAGKDLKSPLELAQANPNFKDYKNVNSPYITYPGNPFAILASIVEKNISLLFPYEPENLTTCEQFLFMLVTEEARTFYLSHCNDPTFDQDYIEDLGLTARAIDFIIYDYNNTGLTGPVSNFFTDKAHVVAFAESKLEDYILTGAQGDYKNYMLNIYTDINYPSIEKSDFSVKTFYSCFFNLNDLPFPELLNNIICLIGEFSSDDYFKTGVNPGSGAALLLGVWRRENNWARFDEIVSKVTNLDAYTDQNRQDLINELKLHQQILWEKYITKNYTGHPFGVTGDQVVDNLKDLIISQEEDITDLSGAENILIYDLHTTEHSHTNGTYTSNYRGTAGGTSTEHVGFYKLISESSNPISSNEVSFKFETSFCQAANLTVSGWVCPEEELKFHLPIDNSDESAIGFFDIVYPVKIPYPMYSSDCCFGESTNPCQYFTKPMPAFVLAAKIKAKKQAQIENAINLALTFTGVYGAVKGVLLNSTKLTRAMAGVLLASSSIQAISDLDQLSISYKHALGGKSTIETNKYFQAILKLAILIDLLDAAKDAGNIQMAITDILESRLSANDIKDIAVAGLLLDNVKRLNIPDPANLNDADNHIALFAKISEEAKTGNTSVVQIVKQEEADFYRLPIALSTLDKSDNFKAILHTLYVKVNALQDVEPLLEQKINGIMNFLENEGKIDKFVDGLDGGSDALLTFFKNTDNVDDMEKKVKIWEYFDDAFPDAKQCLD